MKQFIFLLFVAATIFSTRVTASARSAWEPGIAVAATKADLDGDGVKDNIRTQIFVRKSKDTAGQYESYHKISVNDQVIYDRGGFGDRFYLADIDRTDKYKEIVIPVDLMPDDAGGILYVFKNKRLHRVSTEAFHWPQFPGNGLFQEHLWEGFWQAKLSYRLNARHQLVPIPQKFHPVDIRSHTYAQLILHPYKKTGIVRHVVPAKRKVHIVKSDLKGWYLIETRNGSGWTHERFLFDTVRLSMPH